MRSSLSGLLVVVCLAVGCQTPQGATADAAPPDAMPYIGPSQARFELPREGAPTSEYYALPFPNDLRVRADGTLDLVQHVRPNVLLDMYVELMSARFAGFGTNQASFVRFTQPFDLATLPATPDAATAADASIYLVDVTAASPEYGRRRPLRFKFTADAAETIGEDWLSCLPYPGFTLRPATTYALVVTSRVHATDGTPIARAPDFDALLGDASDDAAVVAARAVYAPLIAYLDEAGGDERADLVAATVYTTQDPVSLMGRIREVIYRDVPAPALEELKFDGRIQGFSLYEAHYQSPNFQVGEPPYLNDGDGGEILLDEETGDPLIQRMEPIRVAITLPDGDVPPGGWPIVLYAHGTGGSYKSFVSDGTAKRFAAEGIAVMGIDQVLHGPRNPGGGSVEINFYNFQNPLAGRDNSRQGALDHFTLVRLAEGAVIDERHPGGRHHHFDPARLYFMGHSQGGITGPLFVAFEPKIRGAIFSGAGGLLYFALLLKTEPVDITAILMSFLRDNPLDEFNNMLALVQMFIEPADPINYARLITREPPPGCSVKDVFQSQGFIDHFTPVPSIGALGVALGGSMVGPLIADEPGFALAGRPVLEAPVSANLGEHTVVFRQYTAPGDSDGHFVVFDVPDAQRQSIQFIVTLDKDGVATLIP